MIPIVHRVGIIALGIIALGIIALGIIALVTSSAWPMSP